jgi:hypothetical protein
MLSREEVYALINRERDYQDSHYKGAKKPNFDELNHVAEWVAYIRAYLNRAESKFLGGAGGLLEGHNYDNDPEGAHRVHHQEVMKDLIKVAALAVACLEYRGEIL